MSKEERMKSKSLSDFDLPFSLSSSVPRGASSTREQQKSPQRRPWPRLPLAWDVEVVCCFYNLLRLAGEVMQTLQESSRFPLTSSTHSPPHPATFTPSLLNLRRILTLSLVFNFT